MDTYEKGGFGYHTTMPTDGLRDFHEISVETLKFGLPELKQAQSKLGVEARDLLDSRGLTSVAAPGQYQSCATLFSFLKYDLMFVFFTSKRVPSPWRTGLLQVKEHLRSAPNAKS